MNTRHKDTRVLHTACEDESKETKLDIKGHSKGGDLESQRYLYLVDFEKDVLRIKWSTKS